MFFELKPKAAVLSDINANLINVYRCVKREPHQLIARIKNIPVDGRTYQIIRRRTSRDPISRAADFLYLNRTAWGGIYRLNANGDFNVPFGGGERNPSPLWNRCLLTKASELLHGAELLHSDFERVIGCAGEGDVVYCDPTYTVACERDNGFVRYNENNFSWDDQIRLAKSCLLAQKRGAMIIVSNAHHVRVGELYSTAIELVFHRKSRVCPTPRKRRVVCESLFVLGGKDIRDRLCSGLQSAFPDIAGLGRPHFECRTLKEIKSTAFSVAISDRLGPPLSSSPARTSEESSSMALSAKRGRQMDYDTRSLKLKAGNMEVSDER